MEQIKKQECIELIKMIYRHRAAGGCMHLVLDDDNVGDEDVDSCAKFITETAKEDDARNTWFHCIEMAVCALLRMMTEDERTELIEQAWKEMRYGTDTQE